MVGWTVRMKQHTLRQDAQTGSSSPINAIALKHYMNFFEFPKLRLDQAFR